MALSTTLPSQTTPVYCTDEDILIRAGGDFVVLCPAWQCMSKGVDGAFAANAPWVLSSASTNFAANGVAANMVVMLSAPKSQYPGAGDLLAVDSVTSSTMTLRRAHKDLYLGNPPAPAAGLTAVNFSVLTLSPQIEEASDEIKRRYAVDDSQFGSIQRASNWMYDSRELRQATILTVLFERYVQENRAKQGDFAQKIAMVRQQLDDCLARVQIRWGPFGNSAEPSTLFGCKLSR